MKFELKKKWLKSSLQFLSPIHWGWSLNDHPWQTMCTWTFFKSPQNKLLNKWHFGMWALLNDLMLVYFTRIYTLFFFLLSFVSFLLFLFYYLVHSHFASYIHVLFIFLLFFHLELITKFALYFLIVQVLWEMNKKRIKQLDWYMYKVHELHVSVVRLIKLLIETMKPTKIPQHRIPASIHWLAMLFGTLVFGQ